jgi:predicted dienelactone hydrolase
MPYPFLLSLISPILGLAAAGLSLIASPAFPFEAGTQWISINPPHRNEAERVLIVYPAKADGDAYTLGADQLWTGVPARRNATPVAEKFPLVILSHGSGGNAAGLGWLSTELARNGFIVAAPNHIHSTSGDSIPVESIKFWERAKDVSALIDVLTTDPAWSRLIDPARIGGIGFSLGGTTMMLSAGARASKQALQDYCAEVNADDAGCSWFQRGGVNFSTLDREAFEGSYKEPRLSAMVAIDPGFTTGYQPESIAAIDMPTLFVNLGEGDAIMPAVRSAELARRIKGAGYRSITGAVHFSFLGICNPGGPELLKRYGEDPVCNDGGDIPREELHSQIFFKVAVFLRKTLLER